MGRGIILFARDVFFVVVCFARAGRTMRSQFNHVKSDIFRMA